MMGMTIMQEEPILDPPASDESERRLWFDYLGRINDRQVRSRGSSGATSWALLGVLIAILYKTIPNISDLLSRPEDIKSTFVLSLLESDTILFFLIAYVALLSFYMGVVQTRVHTEQEVRLQWISHFVILTIQLTMAVGHFAAARRVVLGASHLKWFMASIGIMWSANFLSLARGFTGKLRRARRLKIAAPWFKGAKVDPKQGSLILLGFCVTVATISSFGFFWYVLILRRSGADILFPFAASGYAIVILGILGALANKGIAIIATTSYDTLEREIVLERLSPAEIRTRFINQLIGLPAVDWLKDQTSALRVVVVAGRETVDSVAAAVEALESPNQRPISAVKDQARTLLGKLGADVQERVTALKRHQFLISELGEALKTEPVSPSMALALDQWRTQVAELASLGEKSHELTVRLIGISRKVTD
jgi:hypothetical protein